MKFRHILIAPAVTTLVGCAGNKSPGLDADTLRTIHADGIHTSLGMESTFREQTKGKVVAATALAVGAALMGGGNTVPFGARNEPPPEGYLDTSAWKSIFNETEAASFPTPVKAMNESVHRRLASQGIVENPDSRYAIETSSAFWGLDYEKLSEHDNYRLYFDLDIALKRGFMTVRIVKCQGATLEKHSYDDWVANDRERIHRNIAAIGDSCASRLLAQLDLAGVEPQPLVTADTH